MKNDYEYKLIHKDDASMIFMNKDFEKNTKHPLFNVREFLKFTTTRGFTTLHKENVNCDDVLNDEKLNGRTCISRMKDYFDLYSTQKDDESYDVCQMVNDFIFKKTDHVEVDYKRVHKYPFMYMIGCQK